MKPIKLNLDDFKKSELSKKKSKKITAGCNFKYDKENLIMFSTIDPPKTEKPPGQQ